MKKIITIIMAIITVMMLTACSEKEETVTYGRMWLVGSREATLIINKNGKEEYQSITSNILKSDHNALMDLYRNGEIDTDYLFYVMYKDVLPDEALIGCPYEEAAASSFSFAKKSYHIIGYSLKVERYSSEWRSGFDSQYYIFCIYSQIFHTI